MLPTKSINLGNLILCLSDALDLFNPLLSSHQLRTAAICLAMGRELGMGGTRLSGLFTSAALHDVGALSTGEKVSLHRNEVENTGLHCRRGEALFSAIPLLQPLAPVIAMHHSDWREMPGGIDEPCVLEAQMVRLADILERGIDRDAYILHQSAQRQKEISKMAGTALHPDVVDVFMQVSKPEEFWLDIMSPRLYGHLMAEGPYRQIEADYVNMAQVATLFRSLIDFRSHFTATHSTGVSQCATSLALLFGLAEKEVEMMDIAGSFHDLGKLAVPNEILEKPSGLEHDEFAVMRQHTYWTYSLLKSIGGLEEIAEWAAFHHERLDGSGYPFQLPQGRLRIGSRIMMVADISTALIEDRPYRKGMTREGVEKVLINFTERGQLDANVTSVFLDNYKEIEGRVRQRQAEAFAFYEREVSIV